MKMRTVFFSLIVVTATAEQASPPGATFMKVMDVSMQKMDREMLTAPMDGNVDHDFAAMMMPHHQGAIEMAEAELSYGKDPVMRRLAQEIVVDQRSEIDAMLLWLNKNTADKWTKGRR
jgi:uncharacterized protein (DUF305 family)